MHYSSSTNIWWINQFAVPPTLPGGGRHVHLAGSLEKMGCKTTIVSSTGNYMTNKRGVSEMNSCPGVHSFVQIPLGWNGLGNFGKVAKMISFRRKAIGCNWVENGETPDVVIGSSPSLHAALAASEIAKLYDVPFVLEIRDLWPLSLIEVAGVSRRNPIVKWMYKMEKEIVSRATRIISLLPNALTYLEKYDVEPSIVDWIPNGVDGSLYSNTTPNKIKGKISVMYAGSHGLPNGLKTVIDAAKHIQEYDNRITFRFVGEGSSKTNLQEYAAKQGVSNITFEAAIPRHRVPALLASADILVANIPDHELYQYGVSLNKLYEYLASGRPIALASSVADDPVKNAGVGPVALGDDAEGLAKIIYELALLSDEERASLGKKGKSFVEKEHVSDVLAAKVLTCVRKAMEP